MAITSKANSDYAALPSYWTPGKTLAEHEIEIIMSCYTQCGYDKTATAKALGISIRCLRNRLYRSTRKKISAAKYYGSVPFTFPNAKIR